MGKETPCELCNKPASFYCASDSAYLCRTCDSSVHSANFLVARHHRSPISGDDDEACISSTESSTTTSRKPRRSRVDERVEGVLVNWCNRLGIGNNRNDVVVETAMRVVGSLRLVPIRVAIATSFWVGLRDTCRDLKRVEKITGVPGRMILALQKKMERVFNTRRKLVISQEEDRSNQEGWAEC